MQSKKFTV